MTNNNSKKEIKLKPGVYSSEDKIFVGHVELFNDILTRKQRRFLGGNKGIHQSNNLNHERRFN